MPQTILITGASRGLGLEFAKQFKARKERVICVCRSENDKLEEMGVEVLSGIDLRDSASMTKISNYLKGSKIDLLINNAGMYYTEDLSEIHYDHIKEQFHINSLIPLKLTASLLNNFDIGSKVIMLTSILGSIAKNKERSHYGYRMSKTALNMASVSLAHDLRGKGIPVGIFHPGRVNTRMTAFDGDYAPEESASKLIEQIEKLSLSSSGKFIDLEGNELPW